MTRRDLQAIAKQLARPWDTSKSFDHAAPCGTIMPAARIGHPSAGAIWLKVNGEVRQRSDLSQLIWKIPEVIAHLSTLFTLAPGDLIYSGTPAGVGPVRRGDTLHGGVDGIGTVEVRVV
jgi:fumarylpyruvate hydrolase